jgi:hypothetical protein
MTSARAEFLLQACEPLFQKLMRYRVRRKTSQDDDEDHEDDPQAKAEKKEIPYEVGLSSLKIFHTGDSWDTQQTAGGSSRV